MKRWQGGIWSLPKCDHTLPEGRGVCVLSLEEFSSLHRTVLTPQYRKSLFWFETACAQFFLMPNYCPRCRSGKNRRPAFIRSLHTWTDRWDRKMAYFKSKEPEGYRKQTACRAGDWLSYVNICQGRRLRLNSSSPQRENSCISHSFKAKKNITLKVHWKGGNTSRTVKNLQPTVRWGAKSRVTRCIDV